MAVTCEAGMIMYVLPMLLGRTYDMQKDSVGIDIYSESDINKALKNPYLNSQVESVYKMIEKSSQKRDFLGISGELGLKISAGLVDVRGAGEYLKDTSKTEKSVEILIKMTFKSMTLEISPDAKPIEELSHMKKEAVGTHVVKSLVYGGEVYASVNFIAHKAADLQKIKANVSASLSKSGAFDIDAHGKLEYLAKNMSGLARMEIDYFATVPVEHVPTTIEGLKFLINSFQKQVEKINNGNGVPICAELRPLSDFKDEFTFIKNGQLISALNSFGQKFQNLRDAKAMLKSLVSSLPDNVPDTYIEKVVDFSDRLTKTLAEFHNVIGNMDLEQSSNQLNPALKAYDKNCNVLGACAAEIKSLARRMVRIEGDYQPRSIYVHWGKRACGIKASNLLYIGFMTSFFHDGVGAGFQYQCLPENPDLNVGGKHISIHDIGSKLAGVRYKQLSMFAKQGKHLEGLVASCTVCETPSRPTVKTFPGAFECPSDWTEEYAGFIVSSAESFWSKTEYVCLDHDPDHYPSSGSPSDQDPTIVPIMMGGTNHAGSSVPCVVCSK